MLKVKKVEDKEIQKQLCESCSVEYDAEQFAYSGYEEAENGDGYLVGLAQFALGAFPTVGISDETVKLLQKYNAEAKTAAEENGADLLEAVQAASAAYISDLRNADGVADLEALIIMGKSVLYFIYYYCNIRRVYFLPAASEYDRVARLSGFRKNDDGIWFVDTEVLFNTPCHGEIKVN